VKQNSRSCDWLPGAYVRRHILQGIEDSKVAEISEGLNRSKQVDDPSQHRAGTRKKNVSFLMSSSKLSSYITHIPAVIVEPFLCISWIGDHNKMGWDEPTRPIFDRRSWLERRWDLQYRRRLLREGDQSHVRERAGHFPGAALRRGTRERGAR
jgi:hypothetical protein